MGWQPNAVRALHISAPRQAVLDKIFKKAGPKWSNTASQVPLNVAQSAQTLRSSLAEPDDEKVKAQLLDLVSNAPEMPPHLVKLVNQSLDRVGTKITGTQHQQIFRSVVSTDESGQVATKIYMALFENAAVSPQDRLENGRLFFKALRARKLVSESQKLAAALLQNNRAVTDEFVLQMLAELSDPDPESIAAILTSAPHFDKSLQRGLIMLNDLPESPERTHAANRIVNYALFENPHFEVSAESLTLVLDTLMSFNMSETGRRALQYAMQRSPPTKLEHFELLLMCSIRFQESKTTGKVLVEHIMGFGEQNFVKETWDTLAQWCVYCSDDLQLLKDLIEKMQAAGHVPDSETMHSVVEVASECAQRSESDLNAIVAYFNADLGVLSDAATAAVLIGRALRAVEIEQARKLFIEHQSVDWNMENQKYMPVLYDLVIALCKSPVIDRQVVFDVYQRVRVFSSQLSYPAQVELLKMFFERDNQYDIGMFLVEQFGETPGLSPIEYKEIYHAFVDKILACTDYKEAWGLYGMLNCTVALPYESYYPIQIKFCQLGRPDAAHLMFRHLRNRAKKEAIRPPGREMYLMLFAEYGRWLYEEGVKELETYFRMDLNNDLDIELMNTMLLAYANLQESPKVRDLWFETLSFPAGRGANNASVTIMLRYLTQVSLEAVDDLWVEFPERFGIAPNEANLRQYIVANCYHGYYMRAFDILKAAPETYGIEISASLIESLYNWTLIDSRKALVEKWATENHNEKWLELKASHSLKQLTLPANPDNDSEDSLRAQTIKQLEAPNKLVKAKHVTSDED